MTDKQHTIKAPDTVSGVGLHTGKPVNLTFQPAAENHGFVFQRMDVEGKPEIPALVDHVVDTSRGTTLGVKGVKVHTVEHVLAALVGLHLDNVKIEIDGPEPPALDGSAIEFVKALESAGLEEQEAKRDYFEIEKPIYFQVAEHNVQLAALPSSDYSLNVNIDFNSKILKSQHASLLNVTDFPAQIANSRTFSFLHEVEGLYKSGLIQGGNLDCAVVVVDESITEEKAKELGEIFGEKGFEVKQGFINAEGGLRYDNEQARHKLIALIGDLE